MAVLLCGLYGLFGAGTAWAAKPTIAILGLEVIDPGGAVDAATTGVARDLTEGLRARAKVGAGPYQLAAGSDKELIDEKLMKGCDNEALACMTQIGKDLGADFMLYGKLEKKPDGYQVTLNLLSINKKKFEKSKTLKLALGRDSRAVSDDARKAYNDLTGTVDAGTIVVTTNVSDGTVFLDDVEKGTLTSGSLTIDGLAEGRYRLAVESAGHARSQEVVVTVRSGESAAQSVTLTRIDGAYEVGGTVSEGKTNVWKPITIVAAVGFVASAAVSTYAFANSRSLGRDAGVPPNLAVDNGQDKCGDPAYAAYDNFQKACDRHDLHVYTLYAAAGFGAVAVVSGVLWYLKGDSSSERSAQAASGKKRRSQYSITPVVSADGTGATFQLDW